MSDQLPPSPPGPGGQPPGGYTPERWAEFRDLVGNALSVRQDWMRSITDPRRDIEESCGYPPLSAPVSVELYRQLYDRDAIAARIIEVFPYECWQVQPEVTEDDDAENETEFEEAWDALGANLGGGGTWFKSEHGSVVWEYLKRVDVLSGIGQYGVLLLGIDDGLPLHAPAGGATIIKSKTEPGVTANGLSRARVTVRRVAAVPDAPLTNSDADALRQAKLRYPLNEGEERALRDLVKWGERIVANESRPPFKPKEEPTSRAKTSNGKTLPGMEPVGDDVRGTDAQYYDVGSGMGEGFPDVPSSKQYELTFLRAFDETLVQVVRYESNLRNPRFGMPTMYRITLNDPRDAQVGIGLPLSTVFVHWSRVVHVADNLGSSEVAGRPRLQQVLNNVLGLRKIYNGSPEMFWRGAFPGIALSTHPQLGGDVIVDKDKVRDGMENYFNDLQRYLLLTGMSAETLAPQVSDPSPHITPQLEAICVKLGIPMRKFKGSESTGGGLGKDTGDTDDGDWNDKLRQRQDTYLTPRVVVPFVDRLIQIGVLPEPEQYSITWPDLNQEDAGKQATTALALTQALGAYVTGGLEALISPVDYLTRVVGWEDEVAQSVVDAAAKAHEDAQLEADAGLEEEQGENPDGVVPQLEDSGHVDADGNPVLLPPPPPPPPATALPGRPPVPHEGENVPPVPVELPKPAKEEGGKGKPPATNSDDRSAIYEAQAADLAAIYDLTPAELEVLRERFVNGS